VKLKSRERNVTRIAWRPRTRPFPVVERRKRYSKSNCTVEWRGLFAEWLAFASRFPQSSRGPVFLAPARLGVPKGVVATVEASCSETCPRVWDAFGPEGRVDSFVGEADDASPRMIPFLSLGRHGRRLKGRCYKTMSQVPAPS